MTAAGSPASGAPRRASAYDRTGVALLVAFLGWAWISALGNHTTAWPLTALVAAVAATYVAARSHPEFLDVLAGGLVLFLFGVALLQPAVGSGAAGAPPLGYGNANGALFGLGVAAAALLAVRVAHPWRTVWWSATGAMFLLTAATMSRAATVLALGVMVIAWCAGRWATGMRRWFPLTVPALLAVAVAATIARASGRAATVPGSVEEALSARRVQLWSDAIHLVRAEPWFGVGPGQFENRSVTAQVFRDTSQTHSEYLQVAAETGVLGLALLAGLACWALGALRRSDHDPRAAVIVGAAVAALSTHAVVDYIWHFPAVVVVAASLLGSASARRPAELQDRSRSAK